MRFHISYREELDFSADSVFRRSLLDKIISESYRALDDDELDLLNAAGSIDESAVKKTLNDKEK